MKSRSIILLVVVAVVVGLAVGMLIQRNAYERDLRNLTHYQSTYLSKSGWMKGYGSYTLRSFDGGINWYAVDYGDDGSLKILGPANEVFPDLLERIEGLDQLLEYVEKYGPITLSGPGASEEIRVLEAAGFTVTQE